MPLGKAYNIITLLCNQDDLHPGGSKHYSRQIVPPRELYMFPAYSLKVNY